MWKAEKSRSPQKGQNPRNEVQTVWWCFRVFGVFRGEELFFVSII